MWFFRVIASLLVCSVSSLNTPADFRAVTRGIKEYFQTGYEPKYLPRAFQNYQLKHLFREKKEETHNPTQVCALCNLIATLLIMERKIGISRDTIAQEVEYLCVQLGIETSRVCSGVIDLNVDVFVYIIDNHPNVTSGRVCGSVLQFLGCSNDDEFDWSIEIPQGSSVSRGANSTGGSFQILQLSDIHLDPDYTPDGNADCGEPICCQSDQGAPESPEASCGYWADYRDADAPWHLVEETVRQAKTHNFDYVYYTGDIISHRIWQTSISNNTWQIEQLYSFFKERFDVPVYPVFGNHEPHPLNLWATESVTDERFSMKWLFELAAKSWSELVGEDVSETVLKGGYYTVSPRPGFRIVAINSNFGYTFNWWLIFDDVDPYGQLRWLVDTLQMAEENNESVHILSHVGSGTAESLTVWGREYSRIVERFANTITGQFAGHTHKDEFHVYYGADAKPVGVSFNGASVTPYSDANPSYKIYEVDATTFALKDYEEWTFNLTLANLTPEQSPEWYKLYSFVAAYDVANLDPPEVDKVLYKMARNHSLLDDYFRFWYRNGDTGLALGCDGSCQKKNLCDIATTVYGLNTHCNRFLSLYDQQ